MLNTLQKLREERANSDKGFTLIELLVVVVILGILIAIAIPLYLNYQKNAANKSIESDVRNANTAIAACQADSGSMPTGPATAPKNAATALTGCTTQKIVTSDHTKLTLTFAAGGWTIKGENDGGSGDKNYTFDSAAGTMTAAP